jgi:hypothetical protein
MARREERAYREYVSDEQRSQAGCIGVQSGTVICGRVLRDTIVARSREDRCLRAADEISRQCAVKSKA